MKKLILMFAPWMTSFYVSCSAGVEKHQSGKKSGNNSDVKSGVETVCNGEDCQTSGGDSTTGGASTTGGSTNTTGGSTDGNTGGSSTGTTGGSENTSTTGGSTPPSHSPVTYTTALTSDITTALRNSVYFAFIKKISGQGLPSGACTSSTSCDVVFIDPDQASQAQFCAAMLPGSTPLNSVTSVASGTGWAPYYNLSIAKYVNGSWQRTCTGGSNCAANSKQYLSSLTCGSKF